MTAAAAAALPLSSMDMFATSLSSYGRYQKHHDGDRQTLKQKIIAFHKDEQRDWVADLECGHQQHVRHKPPWMVRPWIETPEGRESRVGVELDCKLCDEMNAIGKKQAGG